MKTQLLAFGITAGVLYLSGPANPPNPPNVPFPKDESNEIPIDDTEHLIGSPNASSEGLAVSLLERNEAKRSLGRAIVERNQSIGGRPGTITVELLPVSAVPLPDTLSYDEPSESVGTITIGSETLVDEETESSIVNDEGGTWVKGAKLNDVFQYLAQAGDFQYFHNSDLDGPTFMVTGHLNDGDPLAQMEELGLMYGITVYTKGSTVYALTRLN